MSRYRLRMPKPRIALAQDDDDDDIDTEEHRRFLAAMAEYPKCVCGQSLWAPQSIARGFCEGCRKGSIQ